jgi:hypothetical protein
LQTQDQYGELVHKINNKQKTMKEHKKTFSEEESLLQLINAEGFAGEIYKWINYL